MSHNGHGYTGRERQTFVGGRQQGKTRAMLRHAAENQPASVVFVSRDQARADQLKKLAREHHPDVPWRDDQFVTFADRFGLLTAARPYVDDVDDVVRDLTSRMSQQQVYDMWLREMGLHRPAEVMTWTDGPSPVLTALRELRDRDRREGHG